MKNDTIPNAFILPFQGEIFLLENRVQLLLLQGSISVAKWFSRRVEAVCFLVFVRLRRTNTKKIYSSYFARRPLINHFRSK
jgi:hypothetical protein